MGSGNASVSDTASAACACCRHFRAAELELEARLPGLRVLGSAFSSVRAQDGLCGLHDRYVANSSRCREFAYPGDAGALIPRDS